MASDNDFDAQKTFEICLLDYLVKNNMHETAENFRKEANVPSHSAWTDATDGFLHEWWGIFYDTFMARQLMHPDSEAETSSEVINTTQNQSNSMVPHIALNQQRPRQFPVATDFDMMIGNPATSSLAAKFYNEEQLRHSMGYNPNLWFCYANNMNPFNSAVSSSSHPQQKLRSQAQQQVNEQGFDLGRSTLMDPALYRTERFILPESALHAAGMNGGVNLMPSNMWPLGAPNHQPQFQMLEIMHQPHLLAPSQSLASWDTALDFPGSPANFACQKLMLPRADLSRKNTKKVGRKNKSTSRGKGKSLTNAEDSMPVDQNAA
ncbi:Transcriptional corepressor LEUNIG [Melia azedarach]|uniref:Transcriptional corepressor LEUNIG n=1 Tax=Melia azedarach TaxID=155640 RepID=A0ACC1WWW9_MELAZ|nr:Transcriptional corepressor LEUNIG [Melia azedarach]